MLKLLELSGLADRVPQVLGIVQHEGDVNDPVSGGRGRAGRRQRQHTGLPALARLSLSYLVQPVVPGGGGRHLLSCRCLRRMLRCVLQGAGRPPHVPPLLTLAAPVWLRHALLQTRIAGQPDTQRLRPVSPVATPAWGLLHEHVCCSAAVAGTATYQRHVMLQVRAACTPTPVKQLSRCSSTVPAGACQRACLPTSSACPRPLVRSMSWMPAG